MTQDQDTLQIRKQIAQETFPEKHYSLEVRIKCEQAMSRYNKLVTDALSQTQEKLSTCRHSMFIQTETMRNISDQMQAMRRLMNRCHTALIKVNSPRGKKLAAEIQRALKTEEK